jgi:hypothetical protein
MILMQEHDSQIHYPRHDPHAQASFRRKVLVRDEGRCTYVFPDGRRCSEISGLVAHHTVDVGHLAPECWYDPAYARTACTDHHPPFTGGGPLKCETCGAPEGTPAPQHRPSCVWWAPRS